MSEENVKQVEVVSTEQENEGSSLINIVDIFFLCLNKWRWIVASVIVCLLIAFFYIKTTPPRYQRMAAVLIKEDSKKTSGTITELSELGGLGLQSNVYNEILTIKSPAVMAGVVEKLGLDVNYYQKGFFYDKLLYGTNLPYQVEFVGMDNVSLTGKLTVKDKKFALDLAPYSMVMLEYQL